MLGNKEYNITMKYEFPSELATHIVDKDNQMVLDVPMQNGECEQAWLNDGKICFPVEKKDAPFRVGDIVRSRNNAYNQYKILYCDSEVADVEIFGAAALKYFKVPVVYFYLDK